MALPAVYYASHCGVWATLEVMCDSNLCCEQARAERFGDMISGPRKDEAQLLEALLPTCMFQLQLYSANDQSCMCNCVRLC